MTDSILPDPSSSPPEAEQRRLRWRDRGLLLAPVLAFGAVLLTLWIAVAWYLVVVPRERLEEQRHELATGVRAIALQTEPVLRQAEQAMRVVDLWLLTRGAAEPLADPSLRELAQGVHSSSRQLVDIAVVDATGRLHRLRGGPDDGASIAGTAAFEQVSGTAPEGITPGPPLRLSSRGAEGPLQLPLLMTLSRPLEQGHLVLALIDLPGLLQAQGPLSTGPHASLVMLRGDGLALARRPEVPGFVGRNLFEQYPNARRSLVGEQGFFNSSGRATDGLPRVGAFVTLREFGIKLLLSDSQDAALARHQRQRGLVLAAAIAATLGLVLLGHRLVQLQRAARLREAMMQATSHAMPLGLFRCDETGRIVYANDNYLQVLGLRREDLDWGWTTLAEPDHRGMQYAPLRVHSGDIEGVIAIEVDVTDARREQAQLRLASQTDALTQTLNRNGFEEAARRALAGGGQLALLYLDLDRFKPVNDTHGHPTGDALLKAVALRLRHALRPADLVARLGGDEFAVLLKDLHAAADAATVADKLVQAIAAPYHLGELELSIGVSVGYSVVDSGGAALEQVVAAADASLYEAKRAGRGLARGGLLAG